MNFDTIQSELQTALYKQWIKIKYVWNVLYTIQLEHFYFSATSSTSINKQKFTAVYHFCLKLI
jgi:hypothetical protein